MNNLIGIRVWTRHCLSASQQVETKRMRGSCAHSYALVLTAWRVAVRRSYAGSGKSRKEEEEGNEEPNLNMLMINILKLNWNSHFGELSSSSSSSCLPFGLLAASSCGRQDTRESVTNCRQLRTIYANPAVWADDQRIVFDCRLWENHKQTQINKTFTICIYNIEETVARDADRTYDRSGQYRTAWRYMYLSRRDDCLGYIRRVFEE